MTVWWPRVGPRRPATPQESAGMVDRHRRERAEFFRRSWKGQQILLNAARSVMAAQQAKEKAALRERQKLERAQLRREQRFRFSGCGCVSAARSSPGNGGIGTADRRRSKDPVRATVTARHPRVRGCDRRRPCPLPAEGRAYVARLYRPRTDHRHPGHGSGERSGGAPAERAEMGHVHRAWQRIVPAPLRRAAVENGFRNRQPRELQTAIAAGRERLGRGPEYPRPRDSGALSPAEAYRLQFGVVARQWARGAADPSRVDAEVAGCGCGRWDFRLASSLARFETAPGTLGRAIGVTGTSTPGRDPWSSRSAYQVRLWPASLVSRLCTSRKAVVHANDRTGRGPTGPDR